MNFMRLFKQENICLYKYAMCYVGSSLFTHSLEIGRDVKKKLFKP